MVNGTAYLQAMDGKAPSWDDHFFSRGGAVVNKYMLISMMVLLGLTACGTQPSQTYPQTAHGENIVGGEDVQAEDPIASMTGLLVNIETMAICTVSILNQDWLVTAAHCVENSKPEKLLVVFSRTVPTTQEEANRTVRPVLGYIAHPQYAEKMDQITQLFVKAAAEGRNVTFKEIDNVKDWADIALIQIYGGLPSTHRPASLLLENRLQNGQQVTLAGYGTTEGGENAGGEGVLRKVHVSVAQRTWGTTEVLMDQSNGKGACHGDSGGPAYLTIHGELKLFGVTSRVVNDPTDSCTRFTAYTNLVPYLDWIKRYTEAAPVPLAVAN